MDASYLNNNVNAALSEAMTSMAVLSPEDPVEFLGQYLLKYVERKIVAKGSKMESEGAEAKLSEFLVLEEKKTAIASEVAAKKVEKESQFTSFLSSLHSCKTKEAAMDTAVTFMETDMSIPAAYIAVKKVVGEAETLHYLSASPSQITKAKGQKLPKAAAEEGEENPVDRLGISFEAFKLPEIPEEEPVEVEEGQEPPPPKPEPKMSPLIIENAMREKKCKFYGIPKLGAYVACPFEYLSAEHEAGCVFTPPDADAGTPGGFVFNKIKSQFIIGFDSVGCYRLFKADEIAAVNLIGEALNKTFEKVEEVICAQHLEYLNSDKLNTMATKVTDIMAKWVEIEAAAISDVQKTLEPDAAADPPPEPDHESKAPAIIAEGIMVALGTTLVPEFTLPLSILAEHPMSPGAAACSILYAMACITTPNPADLCLDCCGMPSWTIIQEKLLPMSTELMASYKPSFVRLGLPQETKTATIKALCEAGNLYDPSVYPANLPVLSMVSNWVNKALSGREAYITYAVEDLKSPIE